MKPLSSQALPDAIASTLQGIDELCDWLKRTRGNAPRLDMEADRLLIQLRRAHNQAQGWRHGYAEMPAIGFFGRSQAGKTALISALAAGDNGRLETSLVGEILDFSININPDSQSAGSAIRFSRRPVTQDPAFPVQLSLLNESELLKIIALAFLPGAGPGVSRPMPEEGEITDRLRVLSMQRQAEPVAGINGDGVIGLWDFLARHDRHYLQTLTPRFWPAAAELCSYLSIDDRARLFSLLWDDIPELTEAYRRFAYALSSLSGAEKVLAPRSVLVDDTRLPADAILDAMAFAGLGTPNDPPITVRPVSETGAAKPVELSLAELSFLTAEVLIPLQSSTIDATSPVVVNPIMGSHGVELIGTDFLGTDIVDFPGYGGSLEAGAPQDLLPAPGSPLAPFADAIGRAKSLFLLGRYADRRQNHLLLVCTAAGARQEAKIVGQTLEYWVKQTQGENARLRGRHKPGLIWALNAFDQRVTQGHNFDEAVQRYVGNPGDSWGTVLAMDERGIKRMAAHLAAELNSHNRQDRIAEDLAALQRELRHTLLAGWYRPEGAENPAVKEQVAVMLLKTLQTRAGVHGELLEQLLPPRSELQRLYLQQSRLRDSVTVSVGGGAFTSADIIASSDGDAPYGIGFDIDLFNDRPAADDATGLFADNPQPGDTDATGGYATEYALSVYRYWVNHLRALAENQRLLTLLGVDKTILMLLAEEFIIASVRLDIPGLLSARLKEAESPDLPPESRADRQVTKALTVLGDFVAWLGFLHIDPTLRPESRVNRGHKIFAGPEKQAVSWDASRRLTKLAPTPANTAAFYIYDWLVGLREMIIQNEGFSADGELTAEQQAQLARILDGMVC
ncbi:virulence factor SrfC family protein [Sodalis sp. dw_96]|uniref:virulence factor SrfC family protein n=1 Tax=Sodalis sp. dw_96 TaxID=2719794 RepID=UPI001BD3ABF8|nr:virulence factor SrfC family protein [Sodalis sp. dw_96]